MSLQLEQTAAIAAVRAASRLSRRVLNSSDKGVVEKADHTPVTIADFAIQALMTASLLSVCPDYAFVGEESATALREDPTLLNAVWDALQSVDDHGVVLPSSREEVCDMIDLCGNGQPTKRRFWIMDPIDGTKTFVRGENYAVNLCLMDKGEQVLAAVGLPLLSENMKGAINNDTIDKDAGIIMHAVRGRGTFVQPLAGGDSTPLTRTDTTSLTSVSCTVGTNSAVPGLNEKIAAKLNIPFPGSNLLGWVVRWAALALGAGNTTFWVYKSRERLGKIWDHAGAILLFTEVGGKVTDVDGKPLDFVAGRSMVANYGFVAAPEALHGRVLEAVRESMKEEGLDELLGQ